LPPPPLFDKIDSVLKDTSGVTWYPPPSADKPDAWVPPAGLIRDFLTDGPHAATAIAGLQTLEKLAAMAGDPAKNEEFQAAVLTFGQGLIKDAESSGSYKKVALDRGYLKANLFSWAKWGFLLLFLLLALSWLARDLPCGGYGRSARDWVKSPVVACQWFAEPAACSICGRYFLLSLSLALHGTSGCPSTAQTQTATGSASECTKVPVVYIMRFPLSSTVTVTVCDIPLATT
jgi:hypothetical protein